MNYLILVKFIDLYCTQNIYSIISFSEFATSQTILFIVITFMALSTYQSHLGIAKMKLKASKENALLIKETEILKNNFSSQRTFDFLNNCRNEIQIYSPETSEVINIFTRMLQYSLNTNIHEKKSLYSEIEYLNNFITLQKLLSTDVMVELCVNGKDSNDIYIFPRILIGVVENAFKHGDTHSKEHPILIQLNADPKQIDFTVTNKKNKHKLVESSGIGNHNLKQQLELLYKNKYTLKIDDQDETYSCSIKLILS